jgi:hypothetical protein
VKRTTRKGVVGKFSSADWSDIYDALLDAAKVHHSGPRADRIIKLRDRIREEQLS